MAGAIVIAGSDRVGDRSTTSQAGSFVPGPTVADMIVLPETTESTPVSISATAASSASVDNRPLAIGDAVMLGAAHLLTRRGVSVDASPSQYVADVVALIEELQAAGTLSESVIIHTGNNGAATDIELNRLFTVLASVQQVIVMTIHPDRPWTAGANDRMIAAAQHFPNIRILDWDAAAAACGGCFEADGVLLSTQGRSLYTQLILEALAQ
ncbi:MAG: hypothetical protein ACRDZ2_00065 [Ilumatobacteraceae bacterium]